MNSQGESMSIEQREKREDANKHEFERYPFGSVKRLFAAFKELTGIDVMKKEEGK